MRNGFAILGLRFTLALSPLLMTLWVNAPLAQQNAVSVNENAEKLESLKAQLEAARQMRDKVIAKRWEDRQKDTEAREAFNQQFDELKAQLEQKDQVADRLHEDILGLLKDAEIAEAEADNARIQFITLSGLMRDRVLELTNDLGRGFPAQIAERQEQVNGLLKEAELKQDAPFEVVQGMMTWFDRELKLTRLISSESKNFVRADRTPGQGLVLRIGTAASAYLDASSNRVGLLIRNSSTTGGLSPWEWHEDLQQPVRDALSLALNTVKAGASAPFALPVDVLMGQGKTNTYVEKPKQTYWQELMHMVKTGGVFMWPLLLIPLVVLWLFFTKHFQIQAARQGSRKSIEELARLIESGQYAQALETAKAFPKSLVAQALLAAGDPKAKTREAAEKAVKELLLKQGPRLEHQLTTLSVMSAAAPLLGLLGTVSGLIAMFQVITEYGVNDPKLLAGGIGEALIATETGLLVAIPTMIAHNWLANRVDDVVAQAEAQAMRILNLKWPQG